jgi:ABC-type transport system substrate-binding protein
VRTVTLNALAFEEIELLAQLIQGAAAQIGITVDIQIDDAGTYYENYWLDSTLGITNYGHRGVPNVYPGGPAEERRHVELGQVQQRRVRRARRRLRGGNGRGCAA